MKYIFDIPDNVDYGVLTCRTSNGYYEYDFDGADLEKLPPANCSEFPNSSDTISRAKAIETLWEKRQALNDYMEILLQDGKMSSRYLTKIERNRIEEDINIIEELPPAQPAPSQVVKDIARIVGNENDMRVIAQGRIRGRWIIRETSSGDTEARCSHCGFTTLVDEPGNGLHMVSDLNFCPNCGADMRGELK